MLFPRKTVFTRRVTADLLKIVNTQSAVLYPGVLADTRRQVSPPV